jgi:predicted aconitase with swiveling domain
MLFASAGVAGRRALCPGQDAHSQEADDIIPQDPPAGKEAVGMLLVRRRFLAAGARCAKIRSVCFANKEGFWTQFGTSRDYLNRMKSLAFWEAGAGKAAGEDSQGGMKQPLILTGRAIYAGRAAGEALVSPAPIGFLGGVDPETGIVIEPGHPLQGESVAGRVLVFPTGKGSTVGSYTILRLAKAGRAPVAIINAQSEAIVAVGAIIAEIPMVDLIDIGQIETGDWVAVDGETVVVARQR